MRLDGGAEGLIADHAYEVIDLYEEDGVRLLKIRNPHGAQQPFPSRLGPAPKHSESVPR
jgi:hypothetical protein